MNHIARLGAALVLPLVLVACSSKSSSDTTPTPAQTVAGVRAPSSATVPTFTSSPSTGSVGAADAAQYKTYVSDVCHAAAQFKTDLSGIRSKVQSDPGSALDTVRGPVETFSQNLKKAHPPSGLEGWQNDLQQRVDAIAQGLRGRDLTQVTKAFDAQFPAVPDGARANLQTAAKGNPDCDQANLFR